MRMLFATVAIAAMAASSAMAQAATHRARPQQAPARVDLPYVRAGTPSVDFRVEGQPRTCGFYTFQYDTEGTPTGPYCH
jgi:hypothetical protein